MLRKILSLLLLFAPAVQAADAELPMTAVVAAGQEPFYSASAAKNLINTALANWENANIDIPQVLPGGAYPLATDELREASHQLIEDLFYLPYVAAAYPFLDTDYGYQLAELTAVREITLLINSIMNAKHLLYTRLNPDVPGEFPPGTSSIIPFLNLTLNKMRNLQENELFTQINADQDINLINIESLDSLEDPDVTVNIELVHNNQSFTYLDGILTGYIEDPAPNQIQDIIVNFLHNPMPAPLPDADSDTDMDSDSDSDSDVDMDGNADQKLE